MLRPVELILLLGSVWLTGTTLTSCGARSGLSDIAGSGGAGANGTDASTGGASTGGASTGGTGASTADAGPEGGLPPCELVSAGDPVVVLALPDQNANTPSAVTLTDGTPTAPASIALQAFASGGSNPEHSNIKLARLSLGQPWPSGVAVDKAPVMAGPESHSFANMVHAPGGRPEVALGWVSDPGNVGRTAFRRFDVNAWQAKEVVDLDFDGSSVLGLSAGAGSGEFGVGYGGIGYGIVWRHLLPDGAVPYVAVLSELGAIQLGPHEVAPSAKPSGPSPDIVWSGASYLMATAFADCPSKHSLCVPNSVVVTRLRPASGDLADDSGVELVTTVATTAGFAPSRPALARFGGDVYMTWREGYTGGAAIPGQILLARLSADGNVVGAPIRVSETAQPLGLLSLSTTELGVTVFAAAVGDPSVPPTSLGHDAVWAYHFQHDLTPTADIAIKATQLGSAWPRAVHLDHPRGLFVVWSGQRLGPGPAVVWGARLDCAEKPTPADAGAADYSAQVDGAGALDRMRMVKRDEARDLCMQVFLVRPGGGEPFAVTLPEQWGIEGINISQGAKNCPASKWEGVSATTAKGSINWAVTGNYPCFIDANISITFPKTAPWVPSNESFSAKGIPVDGACLP